MATSTPYLLSYKFVLIHFGTHTQCFLMSKFRDLSKEPSGVPGYGWNILNSIRINADTHTGTSCTYMGYIHLFVHTQYTHKSMHYIIQYTTHTHTHWERLTGSYNTEFCVCYKYYEFNKDPTMSQIVAWIRKFEIHENRVRATSENRKHWQLIPE